MPEAKWSNFEQVEQGNSLRTAPTSVAKDGEDLKLGVKG